MFHTIYFLPYWIIYSIIENGKYFRFRTFVFAENLEMCTLDYVDQE